MTGCEQRQRLIEQYRTAIFRYGTAVEQNRDIPRQLTYSDVLRKTQLLEFLRLEMAEARENLQDHIIEHECSISLT
jgi:hypothetical protein